MKRLQDIADHVGVSRTTVSHVLHGSTKKGSKEMIRKIVGIYDFGGGAMIAKYLPDNGYTQVIFVAVIPLLQRYFVSGLVVGSVKG